MACLMLQKVRQFPYQKTIKYLLLFMYKKLKRLIGLLYVKILSYYVSCLEVSLELMCNHIWK